ncbi:MAG: hypothetical protein ACYDCK_01335 [Thermoplasmatota archaeon]
MQRPERGRSRERSDAGAASLIGFIVTVAVFAITFGIVTLLLANSFISSTNAASSVDLDVVAANGLTNLASTTGLPPGWAADPLGATKPTQLGLLKGTTETTIDMTKLVSLETTLNSQTWYSGTSRGILGIPNYQYHLRTYPEYPLTSSGDVAQLANARLAYIGHYTTANDPTYTEDPSSSVPESAYVAALGSTYRNVLATSPANVAPVFALQDKYADASYHLDRYLAPKLAGFYGVADTKEGTANDSYWKTVNVDDYPSAYFPNGAGDHGIPHHVLTTSNRNDGTANGWSYAQQTATSTPDRLIVARVDLTNWTSSTVNLELNHHVSGHGGAVSQYGDVEVATCTATCSWTVVGSPWTTTGAGPFWVKSDIDLSPYAGKVAYVSLAWYTSISNDASAHGWFVRSLYVNATSGSGVVTPLYKNELDYTTTTYDAIIVGMSATTANLNDFASGYTFKEALKDWIVHGGSLLAYGSANAQTDFLAPFFTTAAAPVATGPLLVGSSDLTHPVLTSPHSMNFQTYPDAGKTWGGALPQFTQVILGSSAGGSSAPLLAISQQTPLWKGTVVLTAWEPGRINDAKEAHNFLENTLAYARYHPLYLEYGGSIPPKTPIGSASRGAIVDATSYGLGAVEAKLVMYVWV